MNELIAIKPAQVGQGSVNTVNARELHVFLEVGKDFSNWIKAQIKRARLVENRDYVSFAQKGEREIGATVKIEYHLTLEAGKHIAMLSGTEKGFEVREYFIECEAVAKGAAPYAIPTTYKEALLQLVDQVDKNEQLQLAITEAAPKVAFAGAVEKAQSITVDYYVKSISGKDGIIIGRNNFYAWLRMEKMVTNRNLPFQRYIDCGWFEVRESVYENTGTNGPRPCFTTMITGKGQVAIFERLKNSPYLHAYTSKRGGDKVSVSAGRA